MDISNLKYTIDRNLPIVDGAFSVYINTIGFQSNRVQQAGGNIHYTIFPVKPPPFTQGEFCFFVLDNKKTGVIIRPIRHGFWDIDDSEVRALVDILGTFRQWLEQFGKDEKQAAQTTEIHEGRYRLTTEEIEERKTIVKKANNLRKDNPGIGWKEIAKQLKMAERTLRDWRHNPIYQ